jgi:NAD(P)-dependent dehydrogenase (short-subunit alcohol dehydrogenase family)
MSNSKLAVITGGSRGLGKNMALALAKAGVNVIITFNSNEAQAQEVVSQIENLGRKAGKLQLNVADASNFADFFKRLQQLLTEKFGRNTFDFLVNNAGIGVYAAFPETSSEQLDTLFNIHFKAPYMIAQQALPLITDGGAIVNLSSGLARFSNPGYSAYGPMKAAIDALTRYMAAELGERKIRVNSVAPGAIETDFGGGAVRDNSELNGLIARQTALGRVGVPDDIGGVVAFLCSDDAKWINGQRIEVSGGIHL